MHVIDLRGELTTHPLKMYQKRLVSDIKKIAVHHSGTKDVPGSRDVFAFAQHHVKNNGWPGIGYHYVIDVNGVIYKCNSTTTVSYHVSGHNRESLGICLIGNFRNSNPTNVQLKSLHKLLKKLIGVCVLSTDDVLGHNEFDGHQSNHCPSIDMNKVRSDLDATKD